MPEWARERVSWQTPRITSPLFRLPYVDAAAHAGAVVVGFETGGADAEGGQFFVLVFGIAGHANRADDVAIIGANQHAAAFLAHPQSGERLGGRQRIAASRAAQPNRKRFTVRRITGAGALWVTEYVLTYDGRPSYTVSIMEFLDGKVARETQYFGDPFEPGPSRAQWVERLP